MMRNQQLSNQKNDYNQQVTKPLKKNNCQRSTNMANTDQSRVVTSPESSGESALQEKDKLTYIQPNIAQINQRTMTSNCHSSLNR